MATHEDFPGASSFKDRHGKTRWRYRAGKASFPLPGEPGEPAFVAAYEAALTGDRPQPVQIISMPGAALPRSFAAAWRIYVKSAEWHEFDPVTRTKHTRLAEAFFAQRVDGGEGDDNLTWKDVPVADLKRKHVKMILARHAATPTKAKHLLNTVRKMIMVALDEEWIENDPTHKIVWRPKAKGWRAWEDAEMVRFEEFWKIGTTPRAIYAAALWLGQRRSDVARLRRSERQIRAVMIEGKRVEIDCLVRQIKKGDQELAIPIAPMVAEALDALENKGDFYFTGPAGKHRSEKSMTGDMAKWTRMAGLPQGCTLHGLRKTLGKLAAEGGVSTRMSMDLLGHSTLQQVELYSRAANQLRMASKAMDMVIELRAANQLANRKG